MYIETMRQWANGTCAYTTVSGMLPLTNDESDGGERECEYVPRRKGDCHMRPPVRCRACLHRARRSSGCVYFANCGRGVERGLRRARVCLLPSTATQPRML